MIYNIFFIFYSISLILVIIAIFFFIQREKNIRKILIENAKQTRKKNIENIIFHTIQIQLTKSLNNIDILQSLAENLHEVSPASAVSFMAINEDKLIFNSYLAEKVGTDFVKTLKEKMLESLKILNDMSLPVQIEEHYKGIIDDIGIERTQLASYFHVPFVINNKPIGIITFSSLKKNFFSLDEMTDIYHNINDTTNSISHFNSIIRGEKEKLLSLITSLSDGIFMVDANFRLSVINKAAQDILGLYKDTLSIFDVISALSGKFDFGKKIEEAIAEKKTIHEKEMIIGDKTIEIFITPVFNTLDIDEENNTMLGLSVLLHDITLERSLAKLKEDFTNDIVHELRSPLSAIKASSQVIINEEKDTLSQESVKMLTIIKDQSTRMLNDIAMLLDAAKMESGKYIVTPEPHPINQLILGIKGLFTSQAQNKKITLETKIDPKLPDVLIDDIRIGQVLNNLVSNSIKFTPDGGHIIISASYHYNNHLPNTKTNPGVLISVNDNGIGIPKEKQTQLFSKFAQVGGDHQKGTVGTGLGLFVSKGIIEAHGGSIFLESTTEKGTTISFTLPLANNSPLKLN